MTWTVRGVRTIGGSRGAGRVIVEGFVDFDYEITRLTVRHADGITFCAPIGHVQVDGDYRESWQPAVMSAAAAAAARETAKAVVEALGGYGIFGVELFVRGEQVIFSEVSPRPHDTGLVTLVSQDLSEFALHARAVLGLPIPEVRQLGSSASSRSYFEGESQDIRLRWVGSTLQTDAQLAALRRARYAADAAWASRSLPLQTSLCRTRHAARRLRS